MSTLVKRLRSLGELTEYANAGWDLPAAGTAALKRLTNEAANELERLQKRVDELEVALRLVMSYPNIMGYVGSQVSQVADAALEANRD
jgi:archaellum component FlaC